MPLSAEEEEGASREVAAPVVENLAIGSSDEKYTGADATLLSPACKNQGNRITKTEKEEEVHLCPSHRTRWQTGRVALLLLLPMLLMLRGPELCLRCPCGSAPPPIASAPPRQTPAAACPAMCRCIGMDWIEIRKLVVDIQFQCQGTTDSSSLNKQARRKTDRRTCLMGANSGPREEADDEDEDEAAAADDEEEEALWFFVSRNRSNAACPISNLRCCKQPIVSQSVGRKKKESNNEGDGKKSTQIESRQAGKQANLFVVFGRVSEAQSAGFGE